MVSTATIPTHTATPNPHESQPQLAPSETGRPFAPHSPRPPLSREDQALLDTFLRSNLDLDSLAATTARSYAEVLDWADQPAIKERIESFQRFQAAHSRSAFTHHSTTARLNSLKHLQTLADESPNPIEQRRIAHITLRHTERTDAPTSGPLPRATSAKEHAASDIKRTSHTPKSNTRINAPSGPLPPGGRAREGLANDALRTHGAGESEHRSDVSTSNHTSLAPDTQHTAPTTTPALNPFPLLPIDTRPSLQTLHRATPLTNLLRATGAPTATSTNAPPHGQSDFTPRSAPPVTLPYGNHEQSARRPPGEPRH